MQNNALLNNLFETTMRELANNSTATDDDDLGPNAILIPVVVFGTFLAWIIYRCYITGCCHDVADPQADNVYRPLTEEGSSGLYAVQNSGVNSDGKQVELKHDVVLV